MNYFQLFACCRLVRGAARSILCDLQRNKYTFVSNDLAEAIAYLHGRDVGAVEREFAAGLESVRALLAFLLEEEWGFLTDAPEAFPELPLDWRSHATVSNAIVQLGDVDYLDRQIVGELEALGCHTVELQFTRPIVAAGLEAVVELFDQAAIKSLHVYAPAGAAEGRSDFWKDFCRRHYRINNLYVYGADHFRHDKYKNGTSIVYLPHTIDFVRGCGLVHPETFVMNLELFTESQQHNSCLNRKLAIDAAGSIKNCPSMPHSFGRAGQTPLRAVVEQPEFRRLWNVAKDQVAVCRDCEFRYICTDCRAFVEDPADSYAKPLKCGYDPYTASWSAWSDHPLKQKAIDHYGVRPEPVEFQLQPDYEPARRTTAETVGAQ